MNSYLVSQTDNNPFQISKNGQFIVQRKIFSDIYPDFPNTMIFKLYLYLCKSYQWKVRRVTKAKSEMMKDLQLSRSQLDRSLQWLEKHHFLKRTNTHKQQMYQAELLPVPDYNPFTKVYEPIEDIRFDTRELKDRIQGYVMIPADAINNRMLIDDYHINKMWNYQNLKVLIMLYAHCWLGYFGGINPDTVHIEENLNDLSVHPSLCYNLKKTEHQVKKSIRRLLKIDYFKIVQVTFIKGKYVGDTEIVGQPDHSTTKYVLRHYYLADKKVNHKHLREKKGLIII